RRRRRGRRAHRGRDPLRAGQRRAVRGRQRTGHPGRAARAGLRAVAGGPLDRPGGGARTRARAPDREAPRRLDRRRERRRRHARARAPAVARRGGGGVTAALVLATIVIPLYTALLHGGIWWARRREPAFLAFALSALAMAAIAGGLAAQGLTTSREAAFAWQGAQLAAGAVLMVTFLRWVHLFLGVRRPRIEAAALALGVASLAGLAGDVIFSHELELRATLPFHPPAWNAPLRPAGQLLLSGYVLFVVHLCAALGRASLRDAHARPVFAAYLAFAGTLLYDAARGARLADGPELLPFGYLGMVVVISATVIRRFVRSLEDAARLADHWHERVE